MKDDHTTEKQPRERKTETDHNTNKTNSGENLAGLIKEASQVVNERNPRALRLIAKGLAVANQTNALQQKVELFFLQAKAFNTIKNDRKKFLALLAQAEALSKAIQDGARLAKIRYHKAVDAHLNGNFKLVRKLASEILNLDLPKNDVSRINALSMSGAADVTEGKLESALAKFKKTLKIYLSNNDPSRAAVAYLNIGTTIRNMGDYEKALEYGLKALELSQSVEDHERMAEAMDQLGANYVFLENYAKALFYYKQVLKTHLRVKKTPKIIRAKINVGFANLGLGRLKMADQYFQKAFTDLEQHPNERLYAYGLSNFAKLRNQQGRYEEAIKMGLEVLKIERKSANQFDTPFILQVLSASYLATGKSVEAQKYGKQAVVMCRKMKLINQLQNSLSVLASCFEANGDFKNALKTTRELMALNEKTQNENDQKRMAEMETKYRAEKNQIILKETKAKNRIVQKSLKEKEVLLKEIHHRVKNNLQLISSLINLQAHKTDDETTLEALQEGRSRVKAMALIHQKLYQSKDISVIGVQEYIVELVDFLEKVMKKPGLQLTKSIDAKSIDLDIDTVIPLGLILNELVSNVFKYAFEAREKGHLEISLDEQPVGKYLLKVQDNGNGLPADFDISKSRSLGLRLVKNLTHQLDGELTTKHLSPGTAFSISFIPTEGRKQSL